MLELLYVLLANNYIQMILAFLFIFSFFMTLILLNIYYNWSRHFVEHWPKYIFWFSILYFIVNIVMIEDNTDSIVYLDEMYKSKIVEYEQENKKLKFDLENYNDTMTVCKNKVDECESKIDRDNDYLQAIKNMEKENFDLRKNLFGIESACEYYGYFEECEHISKMVEQFEFENVNNNNSIMNKSRIRLFVALSFSLIAVIVYYFESGRAFIVFRSMFCNDIKDYKLIITSAKGSKFIIYRNCIVMIYMFIQLLIFYLCFDLINIIIMILLVTLTFNFILKMYTTEKFVIKYCNMDIKMRKWYSRNCVKNFEQKDLIAMPSAIKYKIGYNYERFINAIREAEIDIRYVYHAINEFALNDIAFIAKQMVDNADRWNNGVRNEAPFVHEVLIGNCDYVSYQDINGRNLNDMEPDLSIRIGLLTDHLNRRFEANKTIRIVVICYLRLLYTLIAIYSNPVLLNRFGANCPLHRNKFTDIMSKQVLEERFLKYDPIISKFVWLRIYHINNKVILYDQTVSEEYSTIQIINSDMNCLNLKRKYSKQRMTVRSSQPDELINFLCTIDNSVEYVPVEDDTMPHPDSHYISKVYHNKNINGMIEKNSINNVLDVGTSFCDINLGYGVVYNLCHAEEADTERFTKYKQRLIKYTLKNNTTSLTVLYGDITRLSLNGHNINKLYMHNCVYNVDLLDTIRMCHYNEIESCVTMTQMARSVLDHVECENKINEMTYSYDWCNNESSLSEANFRIIGMAHGSTYTHNASTLLDWFKINSIRFEDNVFWNKNINFSKHGYYNQSWYLSDMPKQDHDNLQDNEDTMDCFICTKHDDEYSITFTSRSRTSNIRDSAFVSNDDRNWRDVEIKHILRNSLLEKCDVDVIPCNSISDMPKLKWDTKTIYYRIIRPSFEQVKVIVNAELPCRIYNVHQPMFNVFDTPDAYVLARTLNTINLDEFRDCVNQLCLSGVQLYVNIRGINCKVDQHLIENKKNIFYTLDAGGLSVNECTSNAHVRTINLDELFMEIKLVLVDTALKYDKIMNSDIAHIVNEIEHGGIYHVKKLMEKGDGTYTSGEENINIPQPFVKEALDTGELHYNQLTSVSVIDVDHKTMYNPYNILNVDRDGEVTINSMRWSERIEELRDFNDFSVTEANYRDKHDAFTNITVSEAVDAAADDSSEDVVPQQDAGNPIQPERVDVVDINVYQDPVPREPEQRNRRINSRYRKCTEYELVNNGIDDIAIIPKLFLRKNMKRGYNERIKRVIELKTVDITNNLIIVVFNGRQYFVNDKFVRGMNLRNYVVDHTLQLMKISPVRSQIDA